MPTDLAVYTQDLRKRYGEVHALDGLNLAVPAGMVYGVLGPNGAGKTTAVRTLATLLRPDSGTAIVGGHNVMRQPQKVRQVIGLAGQYAAVDEILTGRQNLEMFGRLFHLGARKARERAAEILEQFDLTAAADNGVKTYSGGMRRRLDLAASMLVTPKVMFLDEPTTGLDPRGRNEVWASVRSLTAAGTTVLLTTQYLDEADQLAERIAVIEHGKVIAEDTPAALKDAIGAGHIEVVANHAADVATIARVVAAVTTGELEIDEEGWRVHAPVENRVAALTTVARTLQEEGVDVADIGLRRPTLDEVFLQLTGRSIGKTAPEKEVSA